MPNLENLVSDKELFICKENGIVKEGCIHLKAPFGFFTTRDGQTHYFDLCEACYDKITAGFQIPVTIEERTELL